MFKEFLHCLVVDVLEPAFHYKRLSKNHRTCLDRVHRGIDSSFLYHFHISGDPERRLHWVAKVRALGS